MYIVSKHTTEPEVQPEWGSNRHRPDLFSKRKLTPTHTKPTRTQYTHGNTQTQEEPRVLRAAREVAQPVHGGASVALYDFADLDNYKEHEHERDDGGSGSGIHKHLWKQITRSKEGKLPCVRLLSGKKGGLTKKSDDGESGRPNGSSEHGSRPCGQQWVNVPTVAVLLESIGKVCWHSEGGVTFVRADVGQTF